MSLVENLFPFGLWKRILPSKYPELKRGGLNEELPKIKIDFTGPFNEKRLVNVALRFMGSRRYFFSEFTTFAKGAEHNHVLSGFKRISEEFKLLAAVRIRVHGWEISGLKDKPDKGYVRIWINSGETPCSILKDYQERFQQEPKSWGIYNFFSKYFLRREYDDVVVAQFVSDLYGVAAEIKKELGIETIAYEDGLKKTRTWN